MKQETDPQETSRVQAFKMWMTSPMPMTRDEYKQMTHGYFPMLKRWRKNLR